METCRMLFCELLMVWTFKACLAVVRFMPVVFSLDNFLLITYIFLSFLHGNLELLMLAQRIFLYFVDDRALRI